MQSLQKVEYLIIHHSTRTHDFPFLIGLRHKHWKGWEDIGYHFLIGNGKLFTREGIVYPARPEDMEGAHASGYNHNSLGICLIGNFDKEPPHEKQFRALCSLLEAKMEQYKVPIENVLGHRELPNTKKSCPGRFLDISNVRTTLLKQKARNPYLRPMRQVN